MIIIIIVCGVYNDIVYDFLPRRTVRRYHHKMRVQVYIAVMIYYKLQVWYCNGFKPYCRKSGLFYFYLRYPATTTLRPDGDYLFFCFTIFFFSSLRTLTPKGYDNDTAARALTAAALVAPSWRRAYQSVFI